MPDFLLSVMHGDDNALPADVELETLFADVDAFNKALQAEDRMVYAGGMLPASQAFVADASRGADALSAGPYNTTEEYQGGLWIIRADDLEEAKAWAVNASAACHAPVELRAFQEIPEA